MHNDGPKLNFLTCKVLPKYRERASLKTLKCLYNKDTGALRNSIMDRTLALYIVDLSLIAKIPYGPHALSGVIPEM